MSKRSNSHTYTPLHTIQSATCADCGRAWRGPRAHAYADKHVSAARNANHYVWYGYETVTTNGVTTIDFTPIEDNVTIDQIGWVDLLSGDFQPDTYRFSRSA